MKMLWFLIISLFLMVGNVNATYIDDFKGNDKDNVVDQLLIDNNWTNITLGSLELLGKSDEGINVVLNETDGTWSLDPSNQLNINDIGFISVKAGNNSYVFRSNDFNYLFGIDGSPVFTKDVSHISFWKGGGYEGPGGQVPEPITLFLLGSGLLYMSIRRKIK
jgi:hypothetical protein